jgi:hypothetical protein
MPATHEPFPCACGDTVSLTTPPPFFLLLFVPAMHGPSMSLTTPTELACPSTSAAVFLRLEICISCTTDFSSTLISHPQVNGTWRPLEPRPRQVHVVSHHPAYAMSGVVFSPNDAFVANCQQRGAQMHASPTSLSSSRSYSHVRTRMHIHMLTTEPCCGPPHRASDSQISPRRCFSVLT